MNNENTRLNIRKLKKQVKGITLIALIVTIIVLLILAGIALNLTIGQNGIFTRAQKSVNTWRNAETNEQLAMGELEDWMDGYMNGNGGNQGGDDQDDEVIVDTVKIPKGFYYVGGAKDTGLVISDNPADENKYSSSNWSDQANIPSGLEAETGTNGQIEPIVGNQFVWVPVANTSLFQRYDGYCNIGSGTVLQGTIDSCSEPASNAADWETTEHNLMRTSVINNKGFYVARFEASEGTGSKAESKAGAMPWVNIPWGTSMTEIETTGAVYQAQNMYNDSEHAVTSTLIYGVQWDAIMNWIDSDYSKEDGSCNSFVSDSTGQGWYNQSSATRCGYYQKNNIYDLAGNVAEWTMEAYSSDGRVHRGGYFYGSGSDYPASIRLNNTPGYGGGDFIGFRVALYL